MEWWNVDQKMWLHCRVMDPVWLRTMKYRANNLNLDLFHLVLDCCRSGQMLIWTHVGLGWCSPEVMVLCLCVLYALSGARVVVVGGSSWRYLLVIGQLLLQLLGLFPHSRQEVDRWLAGRHRLLHVVVETFPHSGDQEGKQIVVWPF